MSQPNTTSSGRGTATLLAAVLVIVIAIAGIAFLLLSSNDSDDNGDGAEAGSSFAVVDARSVDGPLADLPEAERERVDPVMGPADAPVTIIEYGAYG